MDFSALSWPYPYVPKAMAAIAAEHVEATRQGEALMADISRVNLELLRRRALR
jgi:phage FluMu protein gp41